MRTSSRATSKSTFSLWNDRTFGTDLKTFSQIGTTDDLKEYLSEIVVGESFSSAAQHNFISFANYLTGIRFTLKRAKLKANSDKISKSRFPRIRAEQYKDPFKKYSTENKDDFGKYRHSKEDTFGDKGGYAVFMPGSMKREDAVNAVQELWQGTESWLEPNRTLSIIVEFMFYNINYDTIAYVAQGFLVNTGGMVAKHERWRTFNPNLYAAGRNNLKLAFIYTFQVLFQLVTVYEIIKLIILFLHHAIDICTRKVVFLYLNDMVSIVTAAFALTCMVLWYRMLSVAG